MNTNFDMNDLGSNPHSWGSSDFGGNSVTTPIPTFRTERLSRRQSVASEAIQAASFAVSDYLRDLGLRDPDLIAQETKRLVDQALDDFPPGEPVHTALLTDAAIRQTVRQLAALVKTLANQPDAADSKGCSESLVAANLPGLFAQYPEVLGKPNASSEAAKTMKQVVPKVAPRKMKPQTLRLVPAAYQRLIAFFDFVR